MLVSKAYGVVVILPLLSAKCTISEIPTAVCAPADVPAECQARSATAAATKAATKANCVLWVLMRLSFSQGE
jgi:hypothetical protein